MAILSPSLLAANVLDLKTDIKQTVDLGVKWLHVDVMDGHFVPNLSFGYSVVDAINKLTDATLDVHLMIDKPLRYVEHFCKAGSDYLTIHVEADTPDNIAKTLKKIRDLGVKAGLSLKPGTPIDAIKPYVEMCDLILVMTVEPGFGGQKFMADMMPKLKEIRSMINKTNPSCHLEVDGGVDAVTQKICKENGANVLVAGSAFFKSEDKASFIKLMES